MATNIASRCYEGCAVQRSHLNLPKTDRCCHGDNNFWIFAKSVL